MALPLETRLLAACLHSYEITAAGDVPACAEWTPNPSALVGWIAPPRAYVGGAHGIDAVLVGETQAEIILAFRGTEPVNAPDPKQAVLDWLNDFDGLLVKDPHQPGLVHHGFAAAVNILWPLMWPFLRALTTASPQKTVCVTGHSKGGAVAPLAAVRLAAAGLKPHIVTFAGARCGDPAFAAAFARLVPGAIRYEYQDDIVPHVPLSSGLAHLLKALPWLSGAVNLLTMGYASVGELRFIDWHGKVVGDSLALEAKRTARLVQLLVTCGFNTFGADHDLSPGGGYATAICPGAWKTVPT